MGCLLLLLLYLAGVLFWSYRAGLLSVRSRVVNENSLGLLELNLRPNALSCIMKVSVQITVEIIQMRLFFSNLDLKFPSKIRSPKVLSCISMLVIITSRGRGHTGTATLLKYLLERMRVAL